jgi:23S rRNA-/tRNA-specific pseudouridylate synthase
MKKIPSKYQPKGFRILHEDVDLIVGTKAPGLLTVAANWEKVNTVHNLLNQYVRKGNPRSTKSVFVVHRLDQATSGLLIFAKTEAVQNFLKDNWKTTVKTYYAIVHGRMEKKSGTISSYLTEDDEYVIHSSQDDARGKLAHTEYTVLKENEKFSLIKINLLTGRKNQIIWQIRDIPWWATLSTAKALLRLRTCGCIRPALNSPIPTARHECFSKPHSPPIFMT